VSLNTFNNYAEDTLNCPECFGIWLSQEQLENIIKSTKFVEKPKEPINDNKVEQITSAPRRKRPHFLSGAFDISDDW